MEHTILGSGLSVVSEEPLMALLTFDSEEGPQIFAINESIAHGLIDMLVKFVSREAKPS